MEGKKEEMERRIVNALDRTWHAVGSDMLVDEDGNPDESATMSRSHVVEIICDCSFLEMYGGDDEAVAYLREHYQYGSAEHQALMERAFPFERYGW